MRKALGEEPLVTTRDTVGLPSGPELEVDVREFDNRLERDDFSGAVRLWRGDFLQDTSHPWADGERARYRHRAARAHLGAAAAMREAGRPQQAVDLEIAASELDPKVASAALHSAWPAGSAGGPAAVTRDERPVAIQEAAADIAEEIETGVPRGPLFFGLPSLDNLTAGLPRGAAMIIAGRPNMGVTTLALTLTLYASVQDNRACAHFSPDFDETDLAQRLLAMRTGLSGTALRKGHLKSSQWPRLVRAANELESASLYIDDSPTLGIAELEVAIERLGQDLEGGLDLVVVDDVHMLSGQARIGEDNRRVAEVLFRLCRLARNGGPAIVMTTKISPAVEERAVKQPLLHDIPGYGDLASRPEQALLLFREDYYDPDSDRPGRLEVEVAENRNGPRGIVSFDLVTSGPRILERPASSTAG